MKANKKHLINQIESILADDIAEMQEVDVTSEKIIKLIWPLFEYYEAENKELIKVLKQSVAVIQQWHGGECFDIYYNNAPEMHQIKSILSNDSQKT